MSDTATELIESLKTLRDRIAPASSMATIRHALREQARGQPDLLKLLPPNPQELIRANIDLVADFLATEDGADAVELLTTAFREFVEIRADGGYDE